MSNEDMKVAAREDEYMPTDAEIMASFAATYGEVN